ncbi:DUF397 domain-containing protein [Streptomyces sp. NPDC001700]
MPGAWSCPRASAFPYFSFDTEPAPSKRRYLGLGPNGGRSVRDSKDQSGPAVAFTGGAWNAFILGVRRSEFDR